MSGSPTRDLFRRDLMGFMRMGAIPDRQWSSAYRVRRLQFGLASMLLVTAGAAVCFGAIRLYITLIRGPLLSPWLVTYVCYVSGSAFLGGIAGALGGVLVGAAIRAMRRRDPGIEVYGLMAGATFGCVTASIIATLQASLCEPGRKYAYQLPEWSFWLGLCLPPLAAGLAACWMVGQAPVRPRHNRARFTLWTFGCALLGALVFAGFGFDGYQSNGPPLRFALLGLLTGAGAAFLCLLVGQAVSARVTHSAD